MEESSVYRKKREVVIRKIGGEYILVPVIDDIIEMNCIYNLNETGAFIWDMIDGNRNVSEIKNEMLNEFEAESDDIRKDLEDFLFQIEDLIELAN